jgi:hypothetical protein
MTIWLSIGIRVVNTLIGPVAQRLHEVVQRLQETWRSRQSSLAKCPLRLGGLRAMGTWIARQVVLWKLRGSYNGWRTRDDDRGRPPKQSAINSTEKPLQRKMKSGTY